MYVFAPAAAYVGKWLQSFREFPPRQKPGSFNLDRVMEAITSDGQGNNRLIFLGTAIALLATSSTLPSVAAPHGNAFDGLWSVVIYTQRGDCEPAIRAAVRIYGGRVYADDPSYQAYGAVGAGGAIRVTVVRASQSAGGAGQLRGNVGLDGGWHGDAPDAPANGRPSGALQIIDGRTPDFGVSLACNYPRARNRPDLIRGEHYGQRSCELHSKAEHCTDHKLCDVKDFPCQLGAVHTWGPPVSFRCVAAIRLLWSEAGASNRILWVHGLDDARANRRMPSFGFDAIFR